MNCTYYFVLLLPFSFVGLQINHMMHQMRRIEDMQCHLAIACSAEEE
jgi:hypothetical protein